MPESFLFKVVLSEAFEHGAERQLRKLGADDVHLQSSLLRNRSITHQSEKGADRATARVSSGPEKTKVRDSMSAVVSTSLPSPPAAGSMLTRVTR
jgi:hypothetical protein